MRRLTRGLATGFIAAVAAVGAAQASLVNLGDGTVKDETTNLIWLFNWRASGLNDYWGQVAWAENLIFAGSSDWVLPEIDQYAQVWADVGSSLAGLQAHFANVQVDHDYWSATMDIPDFPWLFRTSNGLQLIGDEQSVPLFATAVRDGGAATPEPATLALVGLALAGLGLSRRQK